jgi:hypothetical protein
MPQPRARFGWVMPALLSLIFIGVVYFAVHSEARDSRRVGQDLEEAVAALSKTLSGIRDEATVRGALPRLSELRGQLDATRAEAAGLPGPVRSRLDDTLRPGLGELREQYRRVTSIPAAAGPVQSVLADLMTLLSAPLGPPPAEEREEAK